MKMKLIALFTGILLSFSAVLAQPKIAVYPGSVLDLEDLYRGQKIEKIVTIKNIGTDTLRITNVKAQCGCTATFMSEKNIGPSDSGQLSIIFNTESQVGKVSKQVYITSNDSSNPKLTIQFSANVIEILKFSPPSLIFDNAKVDSSYTKTMLISNPSKTSEIKIISTEVKMDNLKITLMKNSIMPGEEVQLVAEYVAKKSGAFNGFIQFNTDHPLQKKFEIKTFAWINRNR
ncbi:MAG: DUF1573 domain-containing protein [Ignavibacteriales bacterium]|nr:DUF1573 domain-containing protein [Ignavibacteriales bacterium]